MLALVGAVAITSMLALILSGRVSPLVALIAVPLVAGTVVGGGAQLSEWVTAGLTRIAPVAGMFVFAILFFGVLTDAGLLDPLVALVLRLVGDKPTRIAVGTALLALLIHLDGSGAVCFLVAVPALRPVYDRLGMDRRVLACTASMAAGVNLLPWTGPTLRAASALKMSPTILFAPMLSVQAAGLAFVVAASWFLGKREEYRLLAGRSLLHAMPEASSKHSKPGTGREVDPSAAANRRLLPFNALLALTVLTSIVAGVVEPVVAFMTGTAVALLVNYPGAEEQRRRVDARARARR